jgi:hypothetical protein
LIDRAAALDEIENAHHSVGGLGPGRRIATRHINQAHAVLVAAHFQAFCRDLHAECVDHVVAAITSPHMQSIVRSNLTLNRKLHRGNANPGNIGADFGRFDLVFWHLVDGHTTGNPQRRVLLEELNEWRNAIAHQDFSPAMLTAGRPRLQLALTRRWRRACTALARSFEEVMRQHLRTVTGTTPW